MSWQPRLVLGRDLWKWCLVALALLAIVPHLSADEMVLSDSDLWPGEIHTSDGGANPQLQYRRGGRLPAEAVPRIAGLAKMPNGEIYFCSGLDNRLMKLDAARRVEGLAYTHAGQIRDVAYDAATRLLYFSTVATPRTGESLGDVVIYKVDISAGRETVAVRVRQDELSGQCWGQFAVRDGSIYVATHGQPGRVYQVGSGRPMLVFQTREFPVRGFAMTNRGLPIIATGDGRLMLATGGATAIEHSTFRTNFTDLSLSPPAETRPSIPGFRLDR